MRNSPDLSSQFLLPSARRGLKAIADQLVQAAPGPEFVDERDPADGQRGLVLALALAGLFWLGVAALLRHAFG